MSESTEKSASNMIELFPAKPENIRGKPTLLELLQILKYLVDCSQIHKTELLPVNIMFVALLASLYGQYMASLYPNPASYTDPGITPNYDAANSAADRATIKAIFEHAKKNHLEVCVCNLATGSTRPIPIDGRRNLPRGRKLSHRVVSSWSLSSCCLDFLRGILCCPHSRP